MYFIIIKAAGPVIGTRGKMGRLIILNRLRCYTHYEVGIYKHSKASYALSIMVDMDGNQSVKVIGVVTQKISCAKKKRTTHSMLRSWDGLVILD